MANRIQLRRDTAANWTRENPILSQGEPGFDLTANKLKVGDGVTAWAELAYTTGTTEGLIEFPVIDGAKTLWGAVDEDFTIKTTRTDPGSDADINIYAADDIWMEAQGDDITLTAADEVRIQSNQADAQHEWTFRADGNLILPEGGVIKNFDDSTYSGGGSVGDFIITNTTLSASTGSIGVNKNTTDISWNSGDSTYVVTYATNPGYGYGTKVEFGGTNISEIEGSGQTFYLNPYNYPTNTQWGVYSDAGCITKVDGSGFSGYDPAPPAYTTELIPGAKISIKTGTPIGRSDPGAIEFKIGGKTYGWTIDKDNHLRLPADGGASKILNYYGKTALFQSLDYTTKTYVSTTTTVDLSKTVNILVPQATEGAPHYYVPNGIEGQIMYLVPANVHNGGDEATTVSFDSARWSSGTGPIYISEGARPSWLPFGANSAVATIIFAGGAWNLPS